MRRFLFLLALLPAGLGAAGLEQPASPQDWAQTRALQQAAATGDPVLPPVPGNQGDLLLAASELGAGVAAGRATDFKPGDYDALYSLLQRYRDELAGLGLDVEAMEERLRTAEASSATLAQRLAKLLPLDGAKIHGRLISAFEDFHLLGPLALNFATPNPVTGVIRYQNKTKGDGERFQDGVTRAELEFQVTRGLFSGVAEFDLATLWGGSYSEFSTRRLYGELRTPVAIQMGHIDAKLSPLTLWRNEESDRNEPEPFQGRRERLRRDYELQPERWRVTGVRLSTDLKLFDTLNLELESLSAVPALATGDSSGLPVSYIYRFVGSQGLSPASAGDQLVVSSNTLLEAWRTALRLGPASLGWLGTYFVTVPESRLSNPYRASSELVQGGRLEFKAGLFTADAEGMLSSYVAPGLTTVAELTPLTGTALRLALGLEGERGYLRLKGRLVSSGFHAAGAQGRTQDRNHELLGPLATEQTMIGANGRVGFLSPVGSGYILTPPQNRWNTMLIPPGVLIRRQLSSGALISAGTFGHLLPFSFIDSLAPYGDATPNRQGGGLEGELKLFNGALRPNASYDMAQEPDNTNDPSLDPVNDGVVSPAQVLTKGFSLQQARAGVAWNFELWRPQVLRAGYTWLDVRNGQLSPLLNSQGLAVPFALTAGILEAGWQIWLTQPLQLQLGWRQLAANGVAEKEVVSLGGTATWNQLATGLVLDLGDGLRFDLLWEQLAYDNADYPANAYSLENAYARITVEF